MDGYKNYVSAEYFVDRLEELDQLLENTTNPQLYNSRKQTIDSLRKKLLESENLNEAIERINEDYDTFCAAWLDGQEVPLVPLPWQKQATRDTLNNRKSVILCARKVGKSSWSASYILWECVNKQNVHHIIFAPTRSQLWVMKDFVRHVKSHPLFSKGFVGSGTSKKTTVEFEVTNSSVNALNIGQHGNFDLKRGVAGNRFWVDEFAIVSEDARQELINPLMREAIGGQITKKQILIGTPKLTHNPGLKQEVDEAQESEGVNFTRVTAWDAMDQGIKSPEQMAEVFEHELHIPCKWGQQYGVCPQFLPGWFEDVEPSDAHDGDCPCLRDDKFLMEEMAEFPLGDSRFFPVKWINETGEKYRFTELSQISPNLTDYYMSVDIGLMNDPTVVMIGHIVSPDVDDDYLKLDYWEEIEPFDPMESARGASERHISRIKKLYNMFDPRQVFIDATKALDTIEHLCKQPNRIPRSKIYADETMKNRDGVGIWWSNDRKTELFLNYKRLLEQGRITVPGPSSQGEFWQSWWNDHFTVDAQPTKSGNRLSFNQTGHTIDAMVMLGLCLTELQSKGAYHGMHWDFVDGPSKGHRGVF